MAENKKALEDESLASHNIIIQENTDNNGYFKTYRALFNNVIWLNSTPEQKAVLFTVLSKANWNDNSWEWQGKKYQCKPGEFISSYAKIAKAAGKGISTQNVRTALKRFKKLDFLTVQSTGGYQDGIKVIINNWAIYQADVNRPTNRPLTDIQQTPNSFLTTIEEYKNNINDHSNKSFEEFWNKYPKKVNKKKSETIFLQAIKKTNPQEILKGVDNYNKHIKVNNIQIQYIKHPTTWLNGECWDDEYSNNIQEVKEYVYNPCL